MYVFFIWVSSLILPSVLRQPRISPSWSRRLRFGVNYLQKNFFQQLLFLALPIYYASTTLWSRQVVYLVVLAASAILSTLDVVYDEFLSRRWSYFAVFFAFNLLASINLFLPILWGISNTLSLHISAFLALIGFTTVFVRGSHLSRSQVGKVLVGGGLLLLLIIELGRSFIPPAPLRMVWFSFGSSIDRQALTMVAPQTSLPATWTGRIYGLTAIRAPLGLNERVRHEWYTKQGLVFASPYHTITGGRQQGYRLWTSCLLKNLPPGQKLYLDVKTEGGQLIGRAVLPLD